MSGSTKTITLVMIEVLLLLLLCTINTAVYSAVGEGGEKRV